MLLFAERKKYLNQADSIRFLSLLSQLPILVDYESPQKAMHDLLGLGRSHGLSSYDASYLDLALRKRLPLATLDKNLQKAVKSLNVPLFKD